MPAGRPSSYTQEKADAICARIAAGETLRSITRDEDQPCWQTVYVWMEREPDFANRFARAREIGFDAIAQDAMRIADDSTNDWMIRHGDDDENAGWRLNGDHVQRSKLRIETRLKLLSKWDPKRYGDRIQHANDPENPMPGPASVEWALAELRALEKK